MCTFVNFGLNDGQLPVLSGPVRGSIASLGENPSLCVSSLSVKSQVPAPRSGDEPHQENFHTKIWFKYTIRQSITF